MCQKGRTRYQNMGLGKKICGKKNQQIGQLRAVQYSQWTKETAPVVVRTQVQEVPAHGSKLDTTSDSSTGGNT